MQSSLLKIINGLLLMVTMLQTAWSRGGWMWDSCLPECTCMTVDARKRANCENAGMNEIPTGLSNEIQVLIFNQNNIGKLRSQIFSRVGLVNLQKIYLKNCQIEEVDKTAFALLQLITLIDLTDNKIQRLDPETFRRTLYLRYLYINHNLIKKLDDFLFANLPLLRTVEINFNRISEIGDLAFVNLTKLETLKLENNTLVHLNSSVFKSVGNQKLSFDLRNNPWRCDCQLRQFFEYVRSNSFAGPLLCKEPENLRDQDWEKLRSEQFTCSPDEKKIATTNLKNETHSCQSLADPNLKLNLTFIGISSSGIKLFTDSPSSETKGQVNIAATISKQMSDKTLDEKLSIIINQNELLQQRMGQLEAKIEHLESVTSRKNTDAVPAKD